MKRRVVSSSRFRAALADTLALTDQRIRVLVERRGRKPVALISLDDLQALELLEASLGDTSHTGGGK